MSGLRAQDLVGTWQLLEWEARQEDGTVSRPFGDAAAGYVVYTHDAHMITNISRAGRPAIGGDLLSAPAEARAAAYASFVAYAGSYRVEGYDVIHHVEMSLYPDWVGTEQRRRVQLSADRDLLTLSTGPTATSGALLRSRLRWQRVRA